jgi:glycosyltransferase involved in cell wall biosynthesis
MKRHTIATVIPVYNAEAYIDETLNSVATQLRSPEQIVVINDGSTDQTMERILDWDRRRGPRLTIIEQSNQCVSAARNRGIEHCQADLIAFLDADDLWLPPHLELSNIMTLPCVSVMPCILTMWELSDRVRWLVHWSNI